MENITQLRSLAQAIEQRRTVLELSKNELCKKFGQLGSTKTYGRILDESDDLDGMSVDKQIVNYQAALELVNAFTEDPEENKIYADFEFMRDAMTTVSECLQETDNTRFILVTGDSGAGKTTFIEALKLHPHYSKILYCTEATEAWRLKVNAFLGALLTELGMLDRTNKGDKTKTEMLLPTGTEARLEKLIEHINGRQIIIVIDEGHHLGVEGLNVVKTLINQTRAVVIVLAHPALMAKTTKAAYAEVGQLLKNRLFASIRWPVPTSGDVLEFMRRRGVKFANEKTASEVAKAISVQSKGMGLWKFVKRCTKDARKNRTPLTMDDFARVITKVKDRISLGGCQ
jgi:energy-coupling factor transporter ATP-binding protein EcfA2